MIVWQNHVAGFVGAHKFLGRAFRLIQSVSVAVLGPVAIGPITSQVTFRMNKTIGEIGGSETLGIFKEPKDSGRFKP